MNLLNCHLNTVVIPMSANLFVEVIKTHPDAIIPKYQTDGASGMDLHIWFADDAFRVLSPQETALFETGVAFHIPVGWEGQIRPRSSMSKRGLHVALGTIDQDFLGAVKVCISNLGSTTATLQKGDRIAQIVFAPVGRAALQVVDRLSTVTARGEGSFGSTGK